MDRYMNHDKYFVNLIGWTSIAKSDIGMVGFKTCEHDQLHPTFDCYGVTRFTLLGVCLLDTQINWYDTKHIFSTLVFNNGQ